MGHRRTQPRHDEIDGLINRPNRPQVASLKILVMLLLMMTMTMLALLLGLSSYCAHHIRKLIARRLI